MKLRFELLEGPQGSLGHRGDRGFFSMYVVVRLREVSREPNFLTKTGQRQVIFKRPFIRHERLDFLAGCLCSDFRAALLKRVSKEILLRVPAATLGPRLAGLHLANDFGRAVRHDIEVSHACDRNADFSIKRNIFTLKNTSKSTQADAADIYDRHAAFGKISPYQPRKGRKQNIFRVSFNNEYTPGKEQISLRHIKETGQEIASSDLVSSVCPKAREKPLRP